jgi:hypothetical protein
MRVAAARGGVRDESACDESAAAVSAVGRRNAGAAEMPPLLGHHPHSTQVLIRLQRTERTCLQMIV